MKKSKLFVVDDDAVTRAFLFGVLSTAGYQIEEFADAESVLSRLGTDDRGCITIELKLPPQDGLTLQKKLKERKISLPVLFICGNADIPSVVTAMKQGALDVITKPIQPRAFLTAVEAALRKDEEIALLHATRESAKARWASLSQRECVVCELAGQGLLLKQIAAQLGTREPTVHVQRASAFRKLGVSSLLELVHLLTLVRGDP